MSGKGFNEVIVKRPIYQSDVSWSTGTVFTTSQVSIHPPALGTISNHISKEGDFPANGIKKKPASGRPLQFVFLAGHI
jgi:hypothetical protein